MCVSLFFCGKTRYQITVLKGSTYDLHLFRAMPITIIQDIAYFLFGYILANIITHT